MCGRVGCSQDFQDQGHLVPAIQCRLSVLSINVFCSHYYGLFPQSLFPLIQLEMSHMKFIISSLALLGTTAYIFASIQIHKNNNRSKPLFFSQPLSVSALQRSFQPRLPANLNGRTLAAREEQIWQSRKLQEPVYQQGREFSVVLIEKKHPHLGFCLPHHSLPLSAGVLFKFYCVSPMQSLYSLDI